MLYRTALLVFAAAACAFVHIGAAKADDASPWQGDKRSAVRLVAAAKQHEPHGDVLRGGVELRLQPGWVSYWRYPGDAGVPPRFDFSASENVKAVKISWPAPTRLLEDGATSIGYTGSTTFPLAVTPADATKPVHLRLKLDYGVCQKICVPVEASAELNITGASTAFDADIALAEQRVPRPAKLGDGGAISVRSVRREPGPPAKVVVDIAAPADAGVDLFAEGPSAEWALPVPTPQKDAPPGVHRFEFALDGAPPGAHYNGAVLKLTATAGGRAVEVPLHLD
jgi:DsbC/DsbD-like thiol-disulfide interchange protein